MNKYKQKYVLNVFKRIRTTTAVGLPEAIRIQKALKEEYGFASNWDSEYKVIMQPILENEENIEGGIRDD